MAADKWKKTITAIFAALDIKAEYVALGLRLAADKPRANGWLPCHAMGRPDKTPSAEINVGDGPARGRYRDFGSGQGESLSLFDFAAAWGPAADWKEARKHYATKTNVKLPTGDEDDRATDRLELRDLTAVEKLRWTQSKQGVSPQSLTQAGARGARWPKGLTPNLQQSLLTLPMFGHGLLELDPVAFHSAPLAGKWIQKYRGKGNEPELIRTMTLGSPGLMNVWAIRRLPEAEVVWLTEGLSDMLALQSLLGERKDHLAMSCGGASYHVSEDCCQHFAGKDVRIVFDNDDAGLTGSQVQVGRLVGVAASVRNVRLPKGTKDLRDWVNAGHDYAALWEYSGTFPAIEQADKSEQLKPHQALLENLGVIVCGQLDGTEFVEIYSQRLHKTTLIRDLNRFTIETAILAMGPVVEEHVTDAQDSGPGKASVKSLRKAIAKEGGARLLTGKAPLGCGIWPAGDSVVLVGPQQADVLTPSGDLEPVDLPAIGDQRLHFAGDPWYDRVELRRNLQHARQLEWCDEAFCEAESLFKKWDNWQEKTTPQLVAGLVCATWIQTLWPFRPLVGILGPTNCGKSLLLEETIPPIFGGLAFFCQKPSEAGLRQNIGDTAKAILIDEFEKCRHREQILELLRTASRGGLIPRGSGRGRGLMYGLRHIVWTGAIEIHLPNPADRNRFILLHLKAIPKGPAKLFAPRPADMRDLGQRLLASMLHRWRSILNRADRIRRFDIQMPQRALELYSVPLAVIAEMAGVEDGAMTEFAGGVLGSQHADEEEESTEAVVTKEILESYVPLPRGQRVTVSQLLDGSCGQLEGNEGQALSRSDALAGAGIRVIRNSRKEDSLFIGKAPVLRHLLQSSEHRNQDITLLLSRIPGAEKAIQRIAGHCVRGVLIPESSLEELVGLKVVAQSLF